VLGLVVTDHLFRTFPRLAEGELAKVRASVVNAGVLAELASELGIGACLALGKGEDASGGREKPSILSDAMEAVIGAVYLDGGWEAASQHYKTRLQELAAQRMDTLPRYEVREDGPDHAKRFYATVYIDEDECGTGEGRSKKQAEQAAAAKAWRSLTTTGDCSTAEADSAEVTAGA